MAEANKPTAEQSLALYQSMALIRAVEETIAKYYGEQEMRCPTHLCSGQEAVAAGACLPLRPTDTVVSGHRSHGHYLAKGGDVNAMMAEIYGKATGCAKGKGGSMHLVDLDHGFLGSAPIVGSTIPIGLGAAFSAWQRGEDRVSLIFLGDGSTEAGVLHESLNFAVLKELPAIFVCENNLYSVYSPLDVRQPPERPIVDLAKGHHMDAAQGDGMDPDAVFGLVSQAVDKARDGGGPTFLEFETYRWREHCGPNYDNQAGYRTEDEYLTWRDRDPIPAYEKRLIDTGLASEQTVAEIMKAAESKAEAAIAHAKQQPFPISTSMSADLYATPLFWEHKS